MEGSEDLKRQVVAFSHVIKYFLIGLIVLLAISSTSPYAQNIDAPPAISLDFRCPTYAVSGTQPLTLFADVLGTENEEIVKPLRFRWNTSRGKIESGQGTRRITIAGLDNVEANARSLRVDVVVTGGPPELGNEKSCALTVDPLCSLTPMIDQYGSVDDEIRHLDHFAGRLKASASDSIGYMVSYAGKNACIYEANWRVSRALKYLIERHNIPSKRIVAVDGGFRDKWAVELFIQPNSDCGPLATPTRERVHVHVSGRCR